MFNSNFFVNWYESNGREFPWRNEGVSPFALMVTEILLRQTQAISVSRIWQDFIVTFPDASSLARAEKGPLLEYLKILGLSNQRSSALVKAAGWLVLHHQGRVPSDLEHLLKIPHIGHYSARAVLCFAFSYPIEIVDVNILRFFSRYYDINVKQDIRRNPQIWELARMALPVENSQVKSHNYGLLDFTASICKTKNPICKHCSLGANCKGCRE
jgi:A/G-specific DNA glycosylase